MDRIIELWGLTPQPAQLALAGIGAVVIAKSLATFLQLVLNVFILSGTNVSSGYVFQYSSSS
jgi:17beta-estradiol 17-dehydrogenase / very-long-chain 3-oxoacyl-CoA reductase